MSFTNSGTIALCRTDYRAQPSSFQTVFNKDVAYCGFQFRLQGQWPTCCTVTNQLQHTCDGWHTEDPTPSLKTCTPLLRELFLKSPLVLAASEKWAQRTSCMNSPCSQQSHAHGDFWSYSGLSSQLHQWVDPWPHTNLQWFWSIILLFAKEYNK